MWLLKLKLKHDCIIGNRCQRFQCTSLGYPLAFYSEKGSTYYLHFEKLDGKNVDDFLTDLKKDKHVVKFEANNNTVFFIYKTKEKGIMPGQLSLAAKKVFHTKPVLVDKDGYEHWEIAAWNRQDINDFIKYIKLSTNDLLDFKIVKLIKTKSNEIFFPQLMPHITELQKKALDLAIEEGYYDYPRNIELERLASVMKISLSTYREHLRKAEKAMLPHLMKKMIFK
ncbi:hypothetical protein COV16_04860 [Candidatus Woesearchaeota archaeon CG10_big_fil_rev_8_21_14_0_10_34_8]|nr:MAG: hypothetical protein COV16_04860 [Candidatus Woesearchaeota archaeon CG10_big_fil_rev_8_21_14_0_10_34_8]